jgi:hypothetical protein
MRVDRSDQFIEQAPGPRGSPQRPHDPGACAGGLAGAATRTANAENNRARSWL